MIISGKKNIKSAQNRLISIEIWPEKSHEIGRFLPVVFFGEVSAKMSAKFPRNRPIFP